MADNTVLNSGSGGDTIATDDIVGVKYQRVKLTDGTADSATFINSGHGVAVNALRVELPTDGTGVIATVGAVTAITNALPAGTNAIGKLAANSGVDIGDVDVTTVGTITPGTAATSLGKAEDAAHTSGDVGVMALGVRNDAGTTLATTTGDYIPFSMDANGALRVSGASGTTQYTEDAASAGAESLCLMGAVRRDTAASSSGTDGDYSTLNTDATGNLRVAVTAGGIAGIVNDAAITIGTTEGVPVMGRASAAAPTDVSADNDAVHAWMLKSGAQAVQPTYAGVLGVAGNGASGTGVQRVTLANDSTGVLATVSTVTTVATVTNITNQGHLADDSAFTPATTRVMMAGFTADETATDSVDEGDGGAARMTLDRKVITADYAHTAGGTNLNSLIAPATPAKNVITGAASQLYTIHAFNLLATPVYLKIWDLATGSVTLGTTACTYQYMIPGNTAGAGFVAEFPKGVPFTNGIVTAVTGAISTTDNTSITANSVIVNIGSK